jgi:hypothetical protein
MSDKISIFLTMNQLEEIIGYFDGYECEYGPCAVNAELHQLLYDKRLELETFIQERELR